MTEEWELKPAHSRIGPYERMRDGFHTVPDRSDSQCIDELGHRWELRRYFKEWVWACYRCRKRTEELPFKRLNQRGRRGTRVEYHRCLRCGRDYGEWTRVSHCSACRLKAAQDKGRKTQAKDRMKFVRERHRLHGKWLVKLRVIVDRELKRESLEGVIFAWRSALMEHYGEYKAEALHAWRKDLVEWMKGGASMAARFQLFRLIMESECLRELRLMEQRRSHVRDVVRGTSDLKKLSKDDLVMWIRRLRDEGYLSRDDVDPAPDDWNPR